MNEDTEMHRLSPKAVKVKLISEMIGNVIGFVVVGGLFALYSYFTWPTWTFWILIVIAIISVLGFIWSFIEASYLYKNWRYGLDEEYLHLKHGIFQMEWVTVPMSKIQGVSAKQGPILRRYQLKSITVETMGTSHTIPSLQEDVAMDLKEELARYAKLKDVDD